MMSKHTPPTYKASSFHCPNCDVNAHQTWYDAIAHQCRPAEEYRFCLCSHCDNFSVWYQKQLVHPNTAPVALPHEDMPDDVKADFEEARGIVSQSPRGAAALLRLCVQKLMLHLKEKGESINDDIGSLVKKGLPVQIQQAWDAVRIVGNESVHPGTINLNDTPTIAHALFDFVNIIVQVMIAQPKQIDDLYNSLSDAKLKGIEDRDKTT